MLKSRKLIFAIALILMGGTSMFGIAAAEELKEGDMAPDFELKGSDGKTYKLSDYRGKQAVVLAWFPKAFTPGCTTECKVFASQGAGLKKFDAAYFTASVDRPEKNKEFAESVGANYPILSDPEGKTALAYGVTGAIQKWASRWTFYIGVDGKILYIDKNVHPSTHADDVAKKLGELGVAKKKDDKAQK
jgi:thioredoxin-dependent peroxiredoxin